MANLTSHETANPFDGDDEQLTQQLRERLIKLVELDPIVENVVANDTAEKAQVPITSPSYHSMSISQSNSTALLKSTHLLGQRIPHKSFENHYHLSPIDINVTPDNITDYIAENAQVNKNQLRIHRLVRRGRDISTLSYVTFKIETNQDVGHLIVQPNFWPRHVNIKPWIKKDSTTSASSFLDNRST